MIMIDRQCSVAATDGVVANDQGGRDKVQRKSMLESEMGRISIGTYGKQNCAMIRNK